MHNAQCAMHNVDCVEMPNMQHRMANVSSLYLLTLPAEYMGPAPTSDMLPQTTLRPAVYYYGYSYYYF